MLWDTKLSGEVIGMLCRLCRRHKTGNKYNKTTVWSETPCVCLRKDSVRRHSESLQHKEAVEKELAREHSCRDGGIQQAFQTHILLNKAAFENCHAVFVLASEGRNSSYTKLPFNMLKAVEIMGCSHLKHLQHGENAKYTSRRVTRIYTGNG